MAVPIVRTDYDQLTTVAARFDQQADLTRSLLQQLRQQQEALQAGDWLGTGAQAFYAEMNGQVVPTLNRLAKALETANQTTRQISLVMKAAEDEAARILRANGAADRFGAAALKPAAVAGAADELGAVLANGAAGISGTADLAAGAGMSAFTGKPESVPEPPSRTGTTKGTVEDTVGIVGAVATVISILESGGIIAKAGVGTTIGAGLLPIGSFLLGLKWGLEAEEQEKRLTEFKTKMRVSAALTAVGIMRQRVVYENGPLLPPFNSELNEEGKRELEAVVKATDKSMNAEMDDMLKRDLVGSLYGSVKRPTVQEWQDLHDWYVEYNFRDMASIYSQSKYRVDSSDRYEHYHWWALTPSDRRSDGRMIRPGMKFE
jgi:WXG100 family type VII secretion target